MSTKIYTAYRVKPHIAKDTKLFWTWVRDTYARGEKEVAKVLRQMYEVAESNVKIDSEEYQKALKNYENEEVARSNVAHDFVRKQYRNQAHSSERNVYDFNVSLTVRELDGNLYVVPYCDMMMRDVLDFLKKDPRLEDFCYWDNTDPPDDMQTGANYRRWKARGKIWDALEPWDNMARGRQFLVLEIMNDSRYYQVDPYPEMARKRRLRLDRATRASNRAST